VDIGKRLKIFREFYGYTQEELAEKAAVNAKYYGRIERGESCPTVEKLEKICDALGIKLVEFFLYSTGKKEHNFWLDQHITNIIIQGLEEDTDIHFNRNILLEGCDNCIWYNGYVASMSFDEFELCIYAVGNIKGKLYLDYQEVLEVNGSDISRELQQYISNDSQLNSILEHMTYDEEILEKHCGNVFFVDETNWLTARLVNNMSREIVNDEIILDSGKISDVLSSREAFFDYIFIEGKQNPHYNN